MVHIPLVVMLANLSESTQEQNLNLIIMFDLQLIADSSSTFGFHSYCKSKYSLALKHWRKMCVWFISVFDLFCVSQAFKVMKAVLVI